MGDWNHCERDLSIEDGVTVVFHKVDSHATINSDDDDSGDDERTTATIHLQSNFHVSCDYEDGDAEEARANSPEGITKKTLCPPTFCVRGKLASQEGSALTDSEKPKRCQGLGLFYAFLATVFFSIIALLVKTIEGIHAIEISAIRCFFQMLFTMPLLIYHKTGFLGPRDQRIYLVLRGFIGSNAMILLFYAVQQMPLADATVIMFSNPVFTSILAWIFLKERCTIWDCVFTVFTITGVLLIARPPFLFGDHRRTIDGNYNNHIKGTIAAFVAAIGLLVHSLSFARWGRASITISPSGTTLSSASSSASSPHPSSESGKSPTVVATAGC
ncbi:solute carrier family 35 member G1 isoform X2 [Gymnodraco acuticeps]|uniref:Solute carrier family 35 member G1 n=1 Tax=Gymnodraco acuticeps TaxID=8218 RepID=A0A6P8UFJ1_GYMAC|nr:solute carrier family 35 member G1 isoform X2 [Gymnodraco acuticeps]